MGNDASDVDDASAAGHMTQGSLGCNKRRADVHANIRSKSLTEYSSISPLMSIPARCDPSMGVTTGSELALAVYFDLDGEHVSPSRSLFTDDMR